MSAASLYQYLELEFAGKLHRSNRQDGAAFYWERECANPSTRLIRIAETADGGIREIKLKCGNLSKYGYSYGRCLLGLDALVTEVRKRFGKVQLISWGSNVWSALAPRVANRSRPALLSAAVLEAPGQVLSIELGGQALPYLPVMHPGHWGNFGRQYHLKHVKAGYAALGLGLPGLDNSGDGRVRVAREIALA